MNDKYLDKVDYFYFLEQISKLTLSEKGKSDILDLRPITEISLLSQKRARQIEFKRFLTGERKHLPDYIYIFNDQINIASKGGTLSGEELYKVGLSINNYFIYKSSFNKEEYPCISGFFSCEWKDDRFDNDIIKNIRHDGFVQDCASPILREIRGKIGYMSTKIDTVTKSVYKELKNMDYISEDLITERDGFNCIPVKSKFKNKVEGLVIDASATGLTSFIIPSRLFELYNELKELHEDQHKEIRRILKNYSDKISENNQRCKVISTELLNFDITFAIAKFGLSFNCSFPIISEKKIVKIINGKHPKIGAKAIPLNLSIGNDDRALLITGPNTGGKTVVLKTVALFAALVQTGIPVPSSDESEFGIFNDIFVDVGDEQSIDNSLSSFSSHIVKLIDITTNADERSLILMDELGSGTDPDEGTALAIAIIRHLMNKNGLIFVSTHFNGLKYFAEQTEGVLTASMEFDQATLRPAYRLLMGVPGYSKAIEISKHLGLAPSIIDEARSLLKADFFDFERIYTELNTKLISAEDNLREAEILKLRLSEELKSMKEQETHYKTKLKELKIQEMNIEEDLISKNRKDFERIIKEIRENKGTSDSIKSGLNSLTAKSSKIKAEREKTQKEFIDKIKNKTFSRGDTVKIISSGLKGTVISDSNKKDQYIVQVGVVKTNFNSHEMELIKNDINKQIKKTTSAYTPAPSNLSIDVRGLRFEEAKKDVDKFVEQASLAGLKEVKILHGKGTGALRQGITETLSTSPFVERFDFESDSNYGKNYGITVAFLK